MNPSTRAIQVRIGPRVGVLQLAVVTMMLVVGLLIGLILGSVSVQSASTIGPSADRNVQQRGPQSHLAQMHRLRFPVAEHPFGRSTAVDQGR